MPPTRLVFNLGDRVSVSPPIWPNCTLEVQPGDLSQCAPYGSGVYGYQDRFGKDPFKSAPPQEASGGTIYFGNRIAKADFDALLRLLEVTTDEKRYAIFTAESPSPGEDGYLVQMRIVKRFGLRHMFGAITESEYERYPEQQVTILEAFHAFIESEMKRWGTSCFNNRGLYGLFGGDGDYEREELAFGFMMENEYYGVYRIWSRAWLVTK